MFTIIFDIIGSLLSAVFELLTGIFLVPLLIIGGIVLVVYVVNSVTSAKSEAIAAEEREKREKKEAEQAALDEAFDDWHKQLKWCYSEIEKNIRLNADFDPGDLYDPIWKLGETQPESRYKDTFNSTLQKHISWLHGNVNYNLGSGYYSTSYCLSSVRCLKKAYKDDPGFNPIIDTLTTLLKRSYSNIFFIQIPQYGDCTLPGLPSTDIDARINDLTHKLQAIDLSIKNNYDKYYSNISPDLSNVINYAAELIWCIACKRPFNQDKFDEATRVFARYTKRCVVDGTCYTNEMFIQSRQNGQGKSYWQILPVEQLLALLYAKNQIGGQNTVNQERKRISDWVNAAISFGMTKQCYLLPSALAWMGLYELERDVLRQLVERKVNLPEELQDRLGFLESGGTSNIRIYDVASTDGFAYDSSTLEWNNDAFDLFFRKLEMSHRSLDYSLAIAKWTKTLPLSSGQKVSHNQLLTAFADLVEDFDGEIVLTQERAKAINLNNVEYDNSFLFRFTSERTRCVTVLFSSEKYGRNLNITIITLFTPENGLSGEQQKKYALAIKDNIYVQSFKESILQVVDQVTAEKKSIYDDGPSNRNIIS